jgi:hypothetical protein
MNADSGKMFFDTNHDSAVIVRADFDTRQIDSIATHAMAVQKTVTMSTGRGYASTLAYNPLPMPDEWALLPDGTIAIVRGQDYHVDFVHPDGSRTSSPKLPFDWKRVPQEEKERMLDSAKQAAAAREAAAAARAASAPAGAGGSAAGSGGRGGGASVGGVRVAAQPTPGSLLFAMPRLPFTTVDLVDLPDYYPPIRGGTVRSDPDGRVWILPTTSVLAGSGLVYDVVDEKGVLVERVQLPPMRNLVAVGAGGVVYMSAFGSGGTRLERARIIR